ncbi:hypothetical protein ILUMI_07756, partial [Ignelater luminosus]
LKGLDGNDCESFYGKDLKKDFCDLSQDQSDAIERFSKKSTLKYIPCQITKAVLSSLSIASLKKLTLKYIPCQVTKVMSRLVNRLEDLNGNDLRYFYGKDLKKDFCDFSPVIKAVTRLAYQLEDLNGFSKNQLPNICRITQIVIRLTYQLEDLDGNDFGSVYGKDLKKNFYDLLQVQSDAIKGYSKKSTPKYTSCRVTKAVSRLAYRLKDLSGNDLGSFYAKDLQNTFVIFYKFRLMQSKAFLRN